MKAKMSGARLCLPTGARVWLVYVHAIEKRGALGYISDDILEIPHVKTREQFPDMVLWYTFYEREYRERRALERLGSFNFAADGRLLAQSVKARTCHRLLSG